MSEDIKAMGVLPTCQGKTVIAVDEEAYRTLLKHKELSHLEEAGREVTDTEIRKIVRDTKTGEEFCVSHYLGQNSLSLSGNLATYNSNTGDLNAGGRFESDIWFSERFRWQTVAGASYSRLAETKKGFGYTEFDGRIDKQWRGAVLAFYDYDPASGDKHKVKVMGGPIYSFPFVSPMGNLDPNNELYASQFLGYKYREPVDDTRHSQGVPIASTRLKFRYQFSLLRTMLMAQVIQDLMRDKDLDLYNTEVDLAVEGAFKVYQRGPFTTEVAATYNGEWMKKRPKEDIDNWIHDVTGKVLARYVF